MVSSEQQNATPNKEQDLRHQKNISNILIGQKSNRERQNKIHRANKNKSQHKPVDLDDIFNDKVDEGKRHADESSLSAYDPDNHQKIPLTTVRPGTKQPKKSKRDSKAKIGPKQPRTEVEEIQAQVDDWVNLIDEKLSDAAELDPKDPENLNYPHQRTKKNPAQIYGLEFQTYQRFHDIVRKRQDLRRSATKATAKDLEFINFCLRFNIPMPEVFQRFLDD